MSAPDELLVYRIEVPPGGCMPQHLKRFPERIEQSGNTSYDADYIRRDAARIAAFGAIRRAAEIARRHHLKHTAYEDEHGASWASPGKCEAAAIRAAIRAAIGSANQ